MSIVYKRCFSGERVLITQRVQYVIPPTIIIAINASSFSGCGYGS